MNHRIVRWNLIGFSLLLALLVATFWFTGLPVAAGPAAPSNFAITGTVNLPDGGLPLPDGTSVLLMNPNRSTYGWSRVATDTGAFAFPNIPDAIYLVRAIPPVGSPYANSIVVPVDPNRPLVGPLRLTNPSVTGTIYQPGGITPTTAFLIVMQNNLVIEKLEAPNGNFNVGGLPTGTYTMIARPREGDMYWESLPRVITLTPTSLISNVTFTLRLPRLGGRVFDGTTPVPNATVIAFLPTGERRVDQTNIDGKYALGEIPSDVPIRLELLPPPDRGNLLPPPPITITIPLTTPFIQQDLYFQTPPKTIGGIVNLMTASGVSIPVQSAVVIANRVDRYGFQDTRTDARGHYSMTVAPGVWNVTIRPISITTPSDWILTTPGQLVAFDITPTTEFKRVDFIVRPAEAIVMGTIMLPGNVPPPFPITVSMRTAEGIGVSRLLEASGRFSFRIPPGIYKLELQISRPPTGPLYAAPILPPINVHPITPTVIPTITLHARDAIITGSLSTTTGDPVPGVAVVAWNMETRATFESRSAPDGRYYLPVYSGTWMVRPAPQPDQEYVYSGEPLSATLTSRQSAMLNFTLTSANATLNGILVTTAGPVASDVEGWAEAVSLNRQIIKGAPIHDGEFTLYLPTGTYSVTLSIPNNPRYVAPRVPTVITLTDQEEITRTFTVIEKTAKFYGSLWDIRAATVVTAEVPGKVWAWEKSIWAATDLKQPGNLYSLPVPAGVWSLDYAIAPESRYVKVAGPRSYAIAEREAKNVNLPVVLRDGILSGTVKLPNGEPVIGAIVIAEALSNDLNGLVQRTPVNSDGSFKLPLPAGIYNVRAALVHDTGLINPAQARVTVPSHGSVVVNLIFRAPSTTITGRVTLSGTTALTGPVMIWAWSKDDGYNKTIAPVGGVYTLPVLSGQAWTIAAVFEKHGAYWMTRTVPLSVPAAGLTQDLVLVGPRTKPSPRVVVFNAAENQSVELGNGVRIFIPGGALPAEGQVILHITPLAGVPQHYRGEIQGLAYAFEAFTENGEPITENFNQDVTIVFPYDPASLPAGTDAAHLRPAYFSTTTDRWTTPDSFVVDETRHEISMLIDHFTDMGLIGAPSEYYSLFLPLVLRNAQ